MQATEPNVSDDHQKTVGADPSAQAASEGRDVTPRPALRLPTAARLTFASLRVDDAPFLVELLNEPDFLRYIGDRGVRDCAAAMRYVADGPEASYRRYGFGLLAVRVTQTQVPVGICGLLRRPTLENVDLGFAILGAYRGRGYAREAAAAVLRQAQQEFGIERVVAVVQPDNVASITVLAAVGMTFERRIRLASGEPELLLYARAARPKPSRSP